ncbi:protein OSCP1-like protein, partial [Leptotrombidium deliense]
ILILRDTFNTTNTLCIITITTKFHVYTKHIMLFTIVKMSLKALPLLYLNLGGEMMYIIEQRLNAQNICRVKSERVINDILTAMFDVPFVVSLFSKQLLKDREYVNHMFHRIAHSSIMKLNDQSMAKLLELMSMVFKQQLVFCLKPTDLYDITLNHMESVTEMSHSVDVIELIKTARERFVAEYSNINEIEMQFIRQTLLTYFVDVKTRVSVFIHDGTQEMDGTFVLSNNNVIATRNQTPGTIIHFDENGDILSQNSFLIETTFKRDIRRTLLGLNIYGKEENDSKDSITAAAQSKESDDGEQDANDEIADSNSSADEGFRREKQLLSALLGKQCATSAVEYGFWIDFDENKETHEEPETKKQLDDRIDNTIGANRIYLMSFHIDHSGT